MSELLRAGDSDREAVAAELRRAHQEGRLDTAELEDRLERCYAAKTFAQLNRLVDDLPQRREPRERHTRPWPPLLLAPFVVGLLALAIATHGHFVLVWPLLLLVFFRFGRRRPRWR